MKLNKFLVLIFVANCVAAQHKTTAKIENVQESGLHKIILTPEIRSFSREKLDDFRIRDNKGNEIPYYIFQGIGAKPSRSFSDYKILSKAAIPKAKTTIVFENPKVAIDEIVLIISNADVTKLYSISGSDNKEDWFGLVNNGILNRLKNSQDTKVFKTVSLPLSSYRFLKIELNDKKTLPINVLKIGFFTSKIISPNVEEVIANTKIVQFPTNKKTRIYVNFHNRQIINQINFSITGPNLFQRNAIIYVNKKMLIHQNVKIFPDARTYFELNSNTKNSFAILQLYEKEFFVEIDNRDNPPLTFSKIQFFQNQIAVVADLKANEKYTIHTNDSKLSSPEYDLENFKNSIQENLSELKIYDIKQISSKEDVIPNNLFWQKSWFMWLCIGFGGLVIAFFTNSLVRDMKNK